MELLGRHMQQINNTERKRKQNIRLLFDGNLNARTLKLVLKYSVSIANINREENEISRDFSSDSRGN